MKELEGVEVLRCPICGSADHVFESIPLPNLYSEKLSGMLGVDERDLLNEFANHACQGCGAVYKRKWFSRAALTSLFNDHVPSHPKGWDAVSGRFSYENFCRELGLYRKALESGDEPSMSMYRRALTSILDSTPGVSSDPAQRRLIDAIQDGTLGLFEDDGVKALLGSAIVHPLPYKRFAGFSDSAMWDFITSVLGPVERYAEVGCPLWGLLRLARSRGLGTVFYQRQEPNYWGAPCRQNGTHCSIYLNRELGIPVMDWVGASGRENAGLLGMFQYLDHLEDPMAFLTEVFSRFKHAAVVLDKVDEPLYIQHLTGFTTQTMQHVADRFGKTLHSDFEPILASGNILYIFKG